MKAFVTGSTGLLGSNLVRLLLAQGHKVKALARSAEKAERVFKDTAVEIVIGDMQDVAAFAPAMAGCDVLFHCAAYFREYYGDGDHWPKLQKINIDGVREILQAAEAQGVHKAIHVSSSGVIGMKGDEPGDESTPPSSLVEHNLYFQSKVLAEEVVQEFIARHKMPVTMILPGWMMGPGDAAPTDSGQLILDLVHGDLPGVLDGGTSAVDARDVAQAMIVAVENGRSGERYIVGGRLATMENIAQTVADLTGAKVPRKIPYPIVWAMAWASEAKARLTNSETVLTVNGVRTLHASLTVNSTKAERELGATFRPLRETLTDEIRWFAANGYLKKSVDLADTAVAAKLKVKQA